MSSSPAEDKTAEHCKPMKGLDMYEYTFRTKWCAMVYIEAGSLKEAKALSSSSTGEMTFISTDNPRHFFGKSFHMCMSN